MRPSFRCFWCGDLVVPGDLVHALIPGYHYACALRIALGPVAHLQRTCSCYVKDGGAEHDPPGLTKRQSARLVADFVRHQHAPEPGRN